MEAGNNKKEPDTSGELNLVDLLITLLKYKKMIISIIIISVLIGSGYLFIFGRRSVAKPQADIALSNDDVLYYSECLIEPEPDLIEKINWMILRKNFVLNLVEENGLSAAIQKAVAQEKHLEQTSENQISEQEIYRWFRKNLFVTPVSGVITIGFTASEKGLPPKIVEGILNSLRTFFRKFDLESITLNLNLLRQRLTVVQDPSLKETISQQILLNLQDEIRVINSKQYVFKVLDPPSITDRVEVITEGNDRKLKSLESWNDTSPLIPNPRSKHITSRYVLTIIFLLVLSSTIGITIAFFREYLANMKAKNPEKVAELKKHLSIRQNPRNKPD